VLVGGGGISAAWFNSLKGRMDIRLAGVGNSRDETARMRKEECAIRSPVRMDG